MYTGLLEAMVVGTSSVGPTCLSAVQRVRPATEPMIFTAWSLPPPLPAPELRLPGRVRET